MNKLKSRDGAIEGTRTPTPLRVHGPEPCASANSATMAWIMTAAVSATSAEVGRIRRTTKPASRKELHLYSTEASLAVKPATLKEVYEPQPKETKEHEKKGDRNFVYLSTLC